MHAFFELSAHCIYIRALGLKWVRKGYPIDVSDEEWELCAPDLTLMKENAVPRE